VAESLNAVAAGLGAPSSDVLSSVFGHWEALVGPEIAAHAVPTSLRDGVLVLVVDQAGWAAQLRYLTADLQRRICASTGCDAVTDVRIRVAGEDRSPGRGRRPPG
jgi:predicted nucleic acid-binding Zn ribbon protein